MNWKIYSEEKPKPFKQVIAYNPKWKVNKIVLDIWMIAILMKSSIMYY